MKISYNWLKQYIDFNLSPEKLSEILTDTGLEVEGLESFESIKGSLKGVVVGEVLTCEPHPNADKLSVTTVNVGKEDPLPIVCGAPNVAKGQKVAVAMAGTTLYMGNEALTLKKTKIRGEVSEGMICAEDELGLGKSHDGIMVLNPNSIPGDHLSNIFSIEKDSVFEIGLTPNRIDGASHIGTARDIFAYLNLNGESLPLEKPSIDEFKVDQASMNFQVEVENSEACPRYSGVCLTDIEVKESPKWLQNRLKAIGLNPINNIVDITNYVLHETGQPLHAFDADKISGQKIVVKTLPTGTKFTTLDEEDRELRAADLMICDEKEGLCIAGVFGGHDSGVTEHTKRIFIESAWFNPVWVRKTAKHHQLSTDSSFRFERGTDPNGTIYALKRAALLIKEVAGAKIASEVIDVYPQKAEAYPVFLKWSNLNRLIGIEIPREKVKTILHLLDIDVLDETEEGLDLAVATYRVDVKREADVIEEVLRIFGYNNVPIAESVNSTLSYAPKPDPELLENRIAEQLVAQGFLEMMANSLTKEDYYTDLTSFPPEKLVKLVNPLSNDLGVMRQNLLFGGLEAIRLNQNHKRSNLRFYEFGNVYELVDAEKASETKGYKEHRRLSFYLTGDKTKETWLGKSDKTDFYQLKGFAQTTLNRLGIQLSPMNMDYIADEIFQEGIVIRQNQKEIARIGLVNNKISGKFEIEQPVYFADFHWDNILKTLNSKISYQEIPKYPEVRRDLALVIDKEHKFSAIEELAYKTERKSLKKVNLFDVYESDKLGKDKKSYAVSFLLQDENKTLTDKQIDKIMKGLVGAFERKLGAELR